MVRVVCSKCGYEWEYRGLSKFYASCPMCRRVNKLKERLSEFEDNIKIKKYSREDLDL